MKYLCRFGQIRAQYNVNKNIKWYDHWLRQDERTLDRNRIALSSNNADSDDPEEIGAHPHSSQHCSQKIKGRRNPSIYLREKMTKKNGLCIRKALLFIFKAEQNSDAYYIMDRPWGHYSWGTQSKGEPSRLHCMPGAQAKSHPWGHLSRSLVKLPKP